MQFLGNFKTSDLMKQAEIIAKQVAMAEPQKTVPPILKDCPPGYTTQPSTCFKQAYCSTKWDKCAKRGISGMCVGGMKTSCSSADSFSRESCPDGYSMNNGMCYLQTKKEGYTTSLYSTNKYSPYI